LGRLKWARHVEVKAAMAADEASGESTYWEGEAPPSKVLGPVLGKMNSGALGVISLILFAGGAYGLNGIATLPGPWGTEATNVLALYIVLAQLMPMSWGAHVASWVQKKNGM
jgi:hypothetical protein